MVRIMEVEVFNFVQVLFLLFGRRKLVLLLCNVSREDQDYSPNHVRLLTERTATASVIVETAVIERKIGKLLGIQNDR